MFVMTEIYQEDCEAGWKKVEIDDEEGLAPFPSW